MKHFSAFPVPPERPRAALRRAHSLAIAAALACGVALADALPAVAGTVVRGQLRMPPTALAKHADGRSGAETLDPRDAVVYVTVAADAGVRLAGRAGRKEIELRGDRFQPRVLPVMAGSRVRFRNRDRVYHKLFGVSPAGRFGLGDLAPGKSRERRFEAVGVANLFCELHPAAAGFVLVCPNWYFTRADASGAYVLPPLPRGAFVIHAWHPRLGEVSRPLEAGGGGVQTLDLGF
jgi:plastocyanin